MSDDPGKVFIDYFQNWLANNEANFNKEQMSAADLDALFRELMAFLKDQGMYTKELKSTLREFIQTQKWIKTENDKKEHLYPSLIKTLEDLEEFMNAAMAKSVKGQGPINIRAESELLNQMKALLPATQQLNLTLSTATRDIKDAVQEFGTKVAALFQNGDPGDPDDPNGSRGSKKSKGSSVSNKVQQIFQGKGIQKVISSIGGIGKSIIGFLMGTTFWSKLSGTLKGAFDWATGLLKRGVKDLFHLGFLMLASWFGNKFGADAAGRTFLKTPVQMSMVTSKGGMELAQIGKSIAESQANQSLGKGLVFKQLGNIQKAAGGFRKLWPVAAAMGAMDFGLDIMGGTNKKKAAANAIGSTAANVAIGGAAMKVGALAGGKVGATIGTFIGGPAGTAVGGALGAVIGATVGLLASGPAANFITEKWRQGVNYLWDEGEHRFNWSRIGDWWGELWSRFPKDNNSNPGNTPTSTPAPNNTGVKPSNKTKNVNTAGHEISGLVETPQAGNAYRTGLTTTDNKGIYKKGEYYGYGISSAYGWRPEGWHSGVDLAYHRNGNPMRIGDPFTVPVGGKVAHIARGEYGGYGNTVFIEKDGNLTQYSHLGTISKKLKVGQNVEAETVIGTIGQTGNATGPSVHVEMKKGTDWTRQGAQNRHLEIDPVQYAIDQAKKELNPKTESTAPLVSSLDQSGNSVFADMVNGGTRLLLSQSQWFIT